MEVSNETWELVSAIDTNKTNYLKGYIPDISIINKEDAADRALVSKYVYTVFELKKPKSTSGLANDDKGQLLDYVWVLVQRSNYKFQELLTTLARGFATFYQMIAQRSSYIMIEE
ncbi:40281_t:CDS:2 [Gigaspora margarita]|uniref:40281_t:CDS:1 n=1 Tax=Gigaspora margarita TaxID=4874 RepID=A0ABM8VX37_GIGMA|nr:40281_t:CDS:2 [Gigaspora margarita]